MQRGVGRKQASGWRTAGREKRSSAGTEQVEGRWQGESRTRDKVREHAGRRIKGVEQRSVGREQRRHAG
jgi:hypothetical protein